MKKQSVNLFTRLLILCLCALCSVVFCFGFFNSKSASADTVTEVSYYEFESFNYYVPTKVLLNYRGDVLIAGQQRVPLLNNPQVPIGGVLYSVGDKTNALSVDMKFNASGGLSNSLSLRFGNLFRGKYMTAYNDFSPGGINDYWRLILNGWTFDESTGYLTSNFTSDDLSRSNISYNLYLYYPDFSTSGYQGVYGLVTVNFDTSFNGNVLYVKFDSTRKTYENVDVLYPQEYNTSSVLITNRVQYVDENGHSITLLFNSAYFNSPYYLGDCAWESRTYFLSTVLDSNDSYKLGLSEGYANGKTEGYQDGYVEGENIGYKQGEEVGYRKGYQEGSSDKLTGESFMTRVLSIFRVDIFGPFGLDDILMVAVGLSLTLIVLKIFAGG